jgi:hypothetical protein
MKVNVFWDVTSYSTNTGNNVSDETAAAAFQNVGTRLHGNMSQKAVIFKVTLNSMIM